LADDIKQYDREAIEAIPVRLQVASPSLKAVRLGTSE